MRCKNDCAVSCNMWQNYQDRNFFLKHRQRVVNKINLLHIIILIEIPLVSKSVMCGTALSRANVLLRHFNLRFEESVLNSRISKSNYLSTMLNHLGKYVGQHNA